MTHLIKIDSTDMYFGILTTMRNPDRGYRREGVLTYLKVNQHGFVNTLYDEMSEGEKQVIEKIIEKAREKCKELNVELMRY